MSAPPALFARFPGARGHLPHRPLLSGPTPVEPIALPGVPDGRLLVKRDEHSCPSYGGNKPRKLEFVLGRALARGARRLVTTGGLGTHHGLATTILGRQAGLQTTLVLVDQPMTDEVRASLALFVAYGAEIRWGRHVPGAALLTAATLLRAARAGERPALVPTGGSGAVGNLGFVSAGLELAAQVEAGLCPPPAEIFVPVGSGGTSAGLVLGLRLAGLRSRVVPVLVSDILPPSPRSLARSARATLRLLRRADAAVPRVSITASDFPLVRRQVGPGYGALTPAAADARAAAAEAGLALETTYSAKCLAEVRERASQGALPEGPVLFWNTYNAVDVVACAPKPPRGEALPAPFDALVRARAEAA